MGSLESESNTGGLWSSILIRYQNIGRWRLIRIWVIRSDYELFIVELEV